MLYVVKTGCQWRQLPHDFPPYTTVWNFYRRARIKGLWEKVLTKLVAKSRASAGRSENPTYAQIDFQSVKTTGAADERGIDGEKTKGRKRHIVTDIMGHLLAVTVHAANIHDTVAREGVLEWAFENYPTLKGVCADAGYRKTFAAAWSDGRYFRTDQAEGLADPPPNAGGWNVFLAG